MNKYTERLLLYAISGLSVACLGMVAVFGLELDNMEPADVFSRIFAVILAYVVISIDAESRL